MPQELALAPLAQLSGRSVSQMDPDNLEVQGEWPCLEDQVCESLVVEEYWHEGQVAEPANVVWLRSAGAWHRLTIDCGIVFWRVEDTGPSAYTMSELDAEVRLRDLGRQLSLSGMAIAEIYGVAIPGGAEVWLQLRDGPRITFRNLDDHTVYCTG